jgi:photosystem II stability/assembly factor-like uncharacterized protein
MRTMTSLRLPLLLAFLAAGLTMPAAARRDAIPQGTPSGQIDPVLFQGLQFRHLSVFSRGGRSTAVAGVPGNDQLYYMGSTGGGVWRTTDAGTTWRNVSDGYFEAGSIGAIAVSESNPNVIYVGTGSACPRGNVSAGVGLYKSTDAGATWQHVGLRDSKFIGRILIHPTNPDIAYVAALGNVFAPNDERGVYRTRDGGRTWERVLFASNRTGAVEMSMDMKNPNVIFAAMWTVQRQPWTIDSGSTEGGLYRSTDGGAKWEKLSGGLPSKVMVGRIGVSVSRANPRRVYALVEAADNQGGVYRSDDGGTTWTRTYTSRNLLQRAFYYIHIFADPVNEDTVYGLNVAAFRSTDGGKTFGSAGINSHSDYHDMWINPLNPRAMVVANDGGATVSVNGTPWTPQNNQPTSEMYRVTVDTRVPYWVYGAQQDNSTVAVPGAAGSTEATYGVGGGESGHIAVDPRDYNIIYAGNYGGQITRIDRKFGTTDNVKTYADMQTGQRAADMKYRVQWNAPIRISPHTPDVVYTTSQHVHRSRNNGLDWEVISQDLTRNDRKRQNYSGGEGITRDMSGVEVYGTIFAFEESLAQPGVLWAGSDDGLVHVSRDNGKTWTNVTPPNLPEGTVNTIDPSQTDPATAHFAFHRYRMGDFTPFVYQTRDFGKTWRRLADGSNGIPRDHFVRVVREDPVRKGLLFAGTEYGFYASWNDGASWQPFQLNLPRTPVSDMMIYRDDLVVATQGRGFYILDNMAVPRGARAQAPAAILFKPEDGYRAGGQPPTFHYWFRTAPTAPVTIEVTNAQGRVLFTTTAQPGSAPAPTPAGGDAAAAAGRGAGGGGRGAGGGRGGGGGGRGGDGGAPTAIAATAAAGMNTATWTNLRLPAYYTVPPGIVGWGGGGGGPKVPPGVYTVKVSSGSWSESQTFRLRTDPRYQPEMTEAQGAEQLRLAEEIGLLTKDLYDNLARIRQVKQQAREMAAKAGAPAAVIAAEKTLRSRFEAVEGDMTQMQGEGGQDGLNFPGRMDNQLTVLYGAMIAPERRVGTPVLDRYKDLKPPAEALQKRWQAALKDDLAAFNAVATKAGLEPIVVK